MSKYRIVEKEVKGMKIYRVEKKHWYGWTLHDKYLTYGLCFSLKNAKETVKDFKRMDEKINYQQK